jgi:hypothetical protein
VVDRREQTLGMRLCTEDDLDAMAVAAEAALPIPDGTRS